DVGIVYARIPGSADRRGRDVAAHQLLDRDTNCLGDSWYEVRRNRLVDSIEEIAQAGAMPSDAARQAALGQSVCWIAEQAIESLGQPVVEVQLVRCHAFHG